MVMSDNDIIFGSTYWSNNSEKGLGESIRLYRLPCNLRPHIFQIVRKPDEESVIFINI